MARNPLSPPVQGRGLYPWAGGETNPVAAMPPVPAAGRRLCR
jgi:hypothetical protein